jgi:hypothetical protein
MEAAQPPPKRHKKDPSQPGISSTIEEHAAMIPAPPRGIV